MLNDCFYLLNLLRTTKEHTVTVSRDQPTIVLSDGIAYSLQRPRLKKYPFLLSAQFCGFDARLILKSVGLSRKFISLMALHFPCLKHFKQIKSSFVVSICTDDKLLKIFVVI